ncbi:unnamed protein product [Toxocara canis]|uniref:Uncharacterized protein n=1 Tax=Toxocara canis TaxID=6265 RepID=A0A183URE1_TOXCA|nr:unnamed protein product [Toxocara canis]
MTTGAAEVNVKIATVADSEAGYEEGGDHGSSLCERMARIGQPLPVLSDTAVRHLSTANEGVSKTAEKDLSEETMPHSTAVEEKPDTKDRSSRTPFPAPRHHSSVRGNDISCGMSLEMFYQTFLLELDRLYNRMEMSYAHMVRDQIQSVKEEVYARVSPISFVIFCLSYRRVALLPQPSS